MAKKKRNKKQINTNAAEAAVKKDKLTPWPWLIGLAAVLLLFAVFGISEFVENYHHVRKFTFDSSTGELYDKKNDITYIAAHHTYEPIRISKLPYATDGDREYYQIGFVDSSKKEYLISKSTAIATSPDEGSLVFYNPKAMELPDLKTFEADTVLVCDIYDQTLEQFDEKESAIFIKALLESEATDFEGNDGSFVIRLRSEKYSWMSYCVYLYLVGDDIYVADDLSGKKVCLPANARKLFDSDLLSLFK